MIDDDIRVLKGILSREVPPTAGEWLTDPLSCAVYGASVGGCQQKHDLFKIADVRGWGHLQYNANGAEEMDSNTDWIAAANPDRIRRLIDHLESLQAKEQK